ncbi:MAG: PHP domain-containing protein [Actinomycetota bacterium]
MKADLHLHSDASDGTDSPADLMSLVAHAGLEGAALMDHDTLSGIDAARREADNLGIAFIPGTELSVDHESDDGSGIKIHMLAYGVEPGGGPLQDKLEWLRQGRNERNPKIIEKLRDLDYDISIDDVYEQARGTAVGRPHIADALIAKGYFTDRNQVFDGLLNDGGAAYVERSRLTATEAIELTTASGGVTVIAHPLTMNLHGDPFIEVLRDLIAIGLVGIEAHHPLHDVALRGRLSELAVDMGLIATGGSDYHGAGKTGYSVGTGTGDLRVPDCAFEAIQQAIEDSRS